MGRDTSSKKFALVHWTESDTRTVEDYSNLCKITRRKTLKVGWKGELPWEENNESHILDATIVKISTNEKALQALEVSASAQILREKDLKPELHAQKTAISKKKSAKKEAQEKTVKILNQDAIDASSIMDLSSDDESVNLTDNLPLAFVVQKNGKNRTIDAMKKNKVQQMLSSPKISPVKNPQKHKSQDLESIDEVPAIASTEKSAGKPKVPGKKLHVSAESKKPHSSKENEKKDQRKAPRNLESTAKDNVPASVSTDKSAAKPNIMSSPMRSPVKSPKKHKSQNRRSKDEAPAIDSTVKSAGKPMESGKKYHVSIATRKSRLSQERGNSDQRRGRSSTVNDKVTAPSTTNKAADKPEIMSRPMRSPIKSPIKQKSQDLEFTAKTMVPAPSSTNKGPDKHKIMSTPMRSPVKSPIKQKSKDRESTVLSTKENVPASASIDKSAGKDICEDESEPVEVVLSSPCERCRNCPCRKQMSEDIYFKNYSKVSVKSTSQKSRN